MSELKKCPFCGGKAELVCIADDIGAELVCIADDIGYVKCATCGIESVFDSEAATIAAWNRRADEWIPVTERLPEVGKCVLIRQTYHAFLGEHGEYEGVTIGYLHQPTDRRCKPYFYYAAVSDYGDMVRAQSICPGSEFVTHWMPLPEPPKADKGDT